MNKIIVLDENTANMIAAGEVVERPSSVVKELVENSIDAGATKITVEIKSGGVKYIRVIDDGSGISSDDTVMAFERHATSKIRTHEDLDNIYTMGFRGEALASIASVSEVELVTKTKDDSYGTRVIINGGNFIKSENTGATGGTDITVKNIFFNTPARYKFLKKDTTEGSYVIDVVSRIALSHCDISFKLISNGSVVLHTPGNGELKSAIYSIYGKNVSDRLLEVNYVDDIYTVTGYITDKDFYRGNRSYQSFFVNGRYIKSKILTSALDSAYSTYMMKGKYPFAVLQIEVNTAVVDVNVHPAKTEVRFSDEKQAFSSIYHAVVSTLDKKTAVKEITFVKESYKFDEVAEPKKEQASLSDLVKDVRPPVENKTYDTSTYTAPKPAEKVVFEEPEIKYEKKEVEIKPDVDKNIEWLDSRSLGQVFLTYIILQNGEDMYLVDQHAAHERVMYEKILNSSDSNKNTQVLLEPVVFSLSVQESKMLEDNMDAFNNTGFAIEKFGDNSFICREQPAWGYEGDINLLISQVVEDLMQKPRVEEVKEYVAKKACKRAIKANRKLSEIEIDSLLKQLKECDNPNTCPHGRPVCIKITKKEIEKMFKRIV